MCSPCSFDVNYEINPWMYQQKGKVNKAKATSQWLRLQCLLENVIEVKTMPGVAEWPDLVFTANAGLPLPGNQIILSNFMHPERQGEKEINRAWFESIGWSCLDLPSDVIFEGAGDALFDGEGRLWLGEGPRSNEKTLQALSLYVKPIFGLTMVDPKFYHLDTCFCPLSGGHVLYYPDAFDLSSIQLLGRSFGDKLIPVTMQEAQMFCCNAISVGSNVIMNSCTEQLEMILRGLGYTVQIVNLTEFMKSGGSAKCLTLRM
jgi:N-dimethylarginine dimethylaminohydrolase